MTNPIYTRNQYLQASSIPKDTRAATFNEGAFISGVSEDLATLTSFQIGMTTGETQVVFSGFKITTDSGSLDIELFGESSFTAGTTMAIYNTNKTSSAKPPSITALVLNPTISIEGDLQLPKLTIKGDNNTRAINDSLADVPLRLKPLTSYIFRVTHQDVSTRNVDVLLSAFDNLIDTNTFP